MAAESHRRPGGAPPEDDFADDFENAATDPPGLDTADDDSKSRGATDGPLEDDLEDAFDRLVEEGTQRLGRTKTEILVTGFFGGTEVALGVLALVFTYHETGSHLLAGLAFSIGFLALLLGNSELFTEGFLVPVFAVAAKRARPWRLLPLWGGVLVANLVGGWLIMWLVVPGFPELHERPGHAGQRLRRGAVRRGRLLPRRARRMAITLMTRMQTGSDEMVAKMGAAIGIGFLLAGTGLFHSILDSLLIFGALHTGRRPSATSTGSAGSATWSSATSSAVSAGHLPTAAAQPGAAGRGAVAAPRGAEAAAPLVAARRRPPAAGPRAARPGARGGQGARRVRDGPEGLGRRRPARLSAPRRARSAAGAGERDPPQRETQPRDQGADDREHVVARARAVGVAQRLGGPGRAEQHQQHRQHEHGDPSEHASRAAGRHGQCTANSWPSSSSLSVQSRAAASSSRAADETVDSPTGPRVSRKRVGP